VASEQTFVEAAMTLVSDLPALAHLRRNLRGQISRSALFNGPRFAAAVESAYRMAWQNWCDDRS
jgi:predicted O-linked N-acetylglucosamine transferase (SPINDLY family)